MHKLQILMFNFPLFNVVKCIIYQDFMIWYYFKSFDIFLKIN